MSIDVIFNAVFLSPKSAAARFAELWRLLSTRPEFHGPGQVQVYELINAANPVAKVAGYSSDPAVAAQIRRMIAEYAADKYSFVGTWSIRGTRGGHQTHYGVDVTTRSPLARYAPWCDRNIDITWDLGNSHRYTMEGKDDYPNAEQVNSDLQVLIELGAASVWASTDPVVNPLELYAVYHRDPDDYRHDGLPEPLAKWPIDVSHVEVAEEYAQKEYEKDDGLRLFTTSAGPIVYGPQLASGTLNMFYTYLDEMMKGVVRDDIEETKAAGYRAYECSNLQKKWIVVERRSDGAEIVRIDSLKQDADVLTIAYEIIAPGINDIIIRELVPLAVLQSFYGGAFRGSVKQLRYQNTVQGTEDLVPF
jgi:hypothetical protein